MLKLNKIDKRFAVKAVLFSAVLALAPCGFALDVKDKLAIEISPTPLVEAVKPFSQAELQQALTQMQTKMEQKISAWGKTLTAADFERTWRGRQLVKAKRQEVCGIYQSVVDEMYQLAQNNKARLSAEDQSLLQDRKAFISRLGFVDNSVDTQMGFECRLR